MSDTQEYRFAEDQGYRQLSVAICWWLLIGKLMGRAIEKRTLVCRRPFLRLRATFQSWKTL